MIQYTTMIKQYTDIDAFHLELLQKMMEYDFPGKEGLAAQIPFTKSRLKERSDKYQSMEFVVERDEPADVSERMPIELEALDRDGVPIAVLLFVDDGKLDFMEIYKADGTQIKHMPSPAAFTRPKWVQVDESTRVRE